MLTHESEQFLNSVLAQYVSLHVCKGGGGGGGHFMCARGRGGGYSRALRAEKSKSLPFPLRGAVVTNDWCVTNEDRSKE